MFPHRNSSPFVRGVWCGVMKIQYRKKKVAKSSKQSNKICDENNYKDDKDDDDVDEYVGDQNGDNDDVASNGPAH